MFSVMSVRNYIHRGCHVTITHDTLDLTPVLALPLHISPIPTRDLILVLLPPDMDV